MTTATESPSVDHENAEHDADHGHGGSKPRYDDVNTPVIVLVGVISAIVTFLTIAFVQGLCYQWQNSYIRERSTDYVNYPVKEIIEGQKANLSGEIDGTVSIEESIKKMIAENASSDKPKETESH